MQGLSCAAIVVVAFIAGLELSSPGVSLAVIRAAVTVDHAARTHVGASICARLPDADTFEGCTSGS